MQSYNCIIGVITLRQRGEPYTVVQQRYSIGSSAVTTIMKRFRALGISLEELSAKDPEEVQKLIYPQENIRRKDVPMPDFQKYYDRIMAKGSKVNISFCWMEYKEENPDGYESSQFYEYFSRFLKEKCGVTRNVTMAVHRVPGERVYIDWVGDTPELMVDQSTGEAVALHVFCTSVGVSDRFFARCFLDEKTGSFIEGTSNALRFYGAAPKYLVPDNCRTAVKSNTKDELVLNASYEDLEHFYNVIVLPPPYRKPKGYLQNWIIIKNGVGACNCRIPTLIFDDNDLQLVRPQYFRSSASFPFQRFPSGCFSGGFGCSTLSSACRIASSSECA